MMPLRQNRQRKQLAETKNPPPPVGGLNARDEWAAMDPRDATLLTNWFPQASYCEVRRGHASHRTGMTDPVRSLMPYNDLSGSEKLFAAAGGKLWDVTSAGSAATELGSGFTSDDFQYVNFTTTAGLFLIAVNGADTPQTYDGAAWGSGGLSGTGLTVSTLVNVVGYNERLYFVQKNSLNAWYLPAGAKSGALTKLPLGGVFKLGGRLLAAGTVSRDSGDGVNDYIAFISSEGEIVLYQGTNPGDTAAWGLSGRFKTGEPIGHRCTVNLGGDLIVLTTEGAISTLNLVNFDRSQLDAAAVTAKIQTLFNEDARNYRDKFGWSAITYPKGRWLVVNVPINEEITQIQYVMNTITGAWCKFEGYNANCFAVMAGELYFGGNDGKVYKADTGYQDNGGVITADMKTAFNYYGSPKQKQFTLVRPNLTTSGSPTIGVGVNTDFATADVTSIASATASTASVWGTAKWGTAKWGGAGRQIRDWLSVSGIGMCAAIRLRAQVNGVSCRCNAFDVVYEPGQVL